MIEYFLLAGLPILLLLLFHELGHFLIALFYQRKGIISGNIRLCFTKWGGIGIIVTWHKDVKKHQSIFMTASGLLFSFFTLPVIYFYSKPISTPLYFKILMISCVILVFMASILDLWKIIKKFILNN